MGDEVVAAELAIAEVDEADAEVANSQKRTTSRRELARNPRFEQVSPEVGELDESAVEEGLREDPDEMLAMLADLVGATDRRLRELAKRLAASLFLDIARRGPVRPRGVGTLRELPYRPDGGDLDIDASLEAIMEGRGGAIDAERLRVRGWVQPTTALCLLVDRSGSMGGKPLATAALAAAAVANRSPSDYSVLAFGKNVVVAKELSICGSFRFHAEFGLAVRLINEGRVNLRPVITRAFPLSQARQAFELASDRSQAMKVLLDFSAPAIA